MDHVTAFCQVQNTRSLGSRLSRRLEVSDKRKELWNTPSGPYAIQSCHILTASNTGAFKKKVQKHTKSTGLQYTNVRFGRGLKCSPRTDHSTRWNREFHKGLTLACLCPQQINEEKSSALKGVDLITHTVCISLGSLCLAGHSRLRFPHCRCHSSVFKLQSCLPCREHVAPWGASFFLRANWYKI